MAETLYSYSALLEFKMQLKDRSLLADTLLTVSDPANFVSYCGLLGPDCKRLTSI